MTSPRPAERTRSSLIDPDDVATRAFTMAKLREGYDIDGVDTFLNDVVRTLRAHHAGEGEILVTAKEAMAVKFTPTRFRNGYDIGEVDDFLDIVVDTLHHWETRPDRPARPVGDGTAPGVITRNTALGLHETTRQLQMAAFLVWGGDELRIAAPDGTQLRVIGVDQASDGVTLRTAFAPTDSQAPDVRVAGWGRSAGDELPDEGAAGGAEAVARVEPAEDDAPAEDPAPVEVPAPAEDPAPVEVPAPAEDPAPVEVPGGQAEAPVPPLSSPPTPSEAVPPGPPALPVDDTEAVAAPAEPPPAEAPVPPAPPADVLAPAAAVPAPAVPPPPPPADVLPPAAAVPPPPPPPVPAPPGS